MEKKYRMISIWNDQFLSDSLIVFIWTPTTRLSFCTTTMKPVNCKVAPSAARLSDCLFKMMKYVYFKIQREVPVDRWEWARVSACAWINSNAPPLQLLNYPIPASMFCVLLLFISFFTFFQTQFYLFIFIICYFCPFSYLWNLSFEQVKGSHFVCCCSKEALSSATGYANL